MSKVQTLEILKYFEKVSRLEKGLIAIVALLVFWLINQTIFSLKFNQIEQLFIWVLLPLAILGVSFFGYKKSFQIDQNDNAINIKCNLSELMIILNRCGFNLKEQIGNYYVMHTRFKWQYYKQITVKSEGTKCTIFGDVFLIKMLKIDLATLKIIHTAKKS